MPLSSRCNHKIDCSDQSDETDCQYVGFTSGYLKQLIPANEPSEDDNKEATDQQFVYINVTIKSFPNIDTVSLQFTASFYLNIRWFGSRLTFHNLVNLFMYLKSQYL